MIKKITDLAVVRKGNFKATQGDYIEVFASHLLSLIPETKGDIVKILCTCMEKKDVSLLRRMIEESVAFSQGITKRLHFCESGYSFLGNAEENGIKEIVASLKECEAFWAEYVNFHVQFTVPSAICVDFEWK